MNCKNYIVAGLLCLPAWPVWGLVAAKNKAAAPPPADLSQWAKFCTYQKEPTLIAVRRSGFIFASLTKVCTADIKCVNKDKQIIFEGRAYCKGYVYDDECPSARECVLDEDVHVGKNPCAPPPGAKNPRC